MSLIVMTTDATVTNDQSHYIPHLTMTWPRGGTSGPTFEQSRLAFAYDGSDLKKLIRVNIKDLPRSQANLSALVDPVVVAMVPKCKDILMSPQCFECNKALPIGKVDVSGAYCIQDYMTKSRADVEWADVKLAEPEADPNKAILAEPKTDTNKAKSPDVEPTKAKVKVVFMPEEIAKSCNEARDPSVDTFQVYQLAWTFSCANPDCKKAIRRKMRPIADNWLSFTTATATA